MKFIVDAQLPRKLATYLNEKGYDCIHTLDLPKKNATPDQEINELSIKESRIVISKGYDFYNRYFTKLEPYKLLQISTGNLSTKNLIDLFDKNLERIVEEISHNFVVEITKNSLITIF
ncbi:MAG: DUF5615 family PIN-like protein [Bacteroidota bacterium]